MVTFTFLRDKFPNINNSKFRPKNSKHTILTKEARECKESLMLEAKAQYKKSGIDLSYFDPAVHYLDVEYMHYKPNLFTKAGLISKTKGDWDGSIKWVQDAICTAIGIDDSFILSAKVDQLKSRTSDEVYVCIIKVCNQNTRFN